MLVADDLVLCENTREEAEEQLELGRNAIAKEGLPVSRNKTEYLPPFSCHDKVKLGGEEIKNVTISGQYLIQRFRSQSMLHRRHSNNSLRFDAAPSQRTTPGKVST